MTDEIFLKFESGIPWDATLVEAINAAYITDWDWSWWNFALEWEKRHDGDMSTSWVNSFDVGDTTVQVKP